ncbi:Bardet-Biedl syndrome 10 protein isoform X1 [Simochromis diagramma]|uniref:Bardet-Biedl syndrome 10 protein isoform X1 n=1 Tax=Simochromis diagramma TaxID=43689 RepID=UPI001A7EDABD|nr:Bardet-Biedl syndrome 10 protein isoform X1 [Simochromis diagramma]XP_039881567.1 Bardet-Biedl syndrome 10 protein isoform X1 [Simochromis diagramma]
MPPLGHLHMEHVLQAVGVLEAVILRSFGPEGGQVLFTRDTGQAMLSRSGTRILTALHLEHPLARMVVECVWKHSSATGDGSKTFILLLASLLRLIHAAASKESNVSHSYSSTKAAEAATARHLADKLLAFGLKELDELIATGVVPYGGCISWEDFTVEAQTPSLTNNLCVQKLLRSFFHTRCGYTHCDFSSHLTRELLSHWKFKNQLPSFSLQLVSDYFPALHTPVSGFPVRSSRLIEGQVIHRDFATPPLKTDHQPVKAVVLTGSLQPTLLSTGDVLELGCRGRMKEERSILHFSSWMESSLQGVIAKLQTLGVCVLLSAVKQSAAVLALATQAEMCLVECVSEDELSLFSQLSGTTPIWDCSMIESEHVATLAFCRPIQLGAHRYVHVAFQDSEERITIKPCSLIICAPGEGQIEQYACALQDAIRMLLRTWEPMHAAATTTSKSTPQSHKGASLHTDSLTEQTTYRSIAIQPIQKCVLKPGCVLSAGGLFELLLHYALLQHGHSCSVSPDLNIDASVSQLLANALLSVPQKIYSHSPHHFLESQRRVISFVSKFPKDSHPFSLVYKRENTISPIQVEGPLGDGKLSLHCCREGDKLSKVSELDLGLESVSCKYQLLLAVLQCVASLLKVDAVLPTHTALHTQSRRLTRTSWEGTEDEGED